MNPEVVELPIEDLEFSPDNANIMDEHKFNELVKKIKDEGFIDPARVTPLGDGKYRIYGGEHRIKAAQILGLQKVKCVVRELDDDRRKFEMVKDNVIHGKIDIHKFTKLYESLNEKYGKEVIAEMMGMETTEIDKLVRYALETLPDQLKKKLQAAKGEIKTIEDLSTILNRLFNEYGDTLQHHFMIIDYGGKDSIWIQADNELWGMVQSMANYCEEQKIDINEYMKVALGQIKSNPALMDLAHSEKIVPPSENTPPPQETTPLPDTQSGNDEQTISQP